MTGLWPLLLAGCIEATGQPTLGARLATHVSAIEVTGRAGTGYQSVQAAIDFDSYRAEAEHRWDEHGEQVICRSVLLLSPTCTLDIEKLVHTEVHWDRAYQGVVPSKRVLEAGGQAHLTWRWGWLDLRVTGSTQRELGLTALARF